MKILIVGNGGREHAIAWKIAQSPQTDLIFVAPGNAGTALLNNAKNISIKSTDIDALLTFAFQEKIDLTIIGPEAPLAMGIVDKFTAQGLRCFGPTQAAAQLEASKSFAKNFMKKHEIPTANYQLFTEAADAKAYLHDQTFPLVIKADGLAAGKGVVIVNDETHAAKIVDQILSEGRFGEAGRRIVIEDYLEGQEASFIIMTDGDCILPLASSQDHKRRDNGDQGPNTGGMGAYSPAPIITPNIQEAILDTVIRPTITGLKEEGISYTGFLYAGLMIDPAGKINVLEFNCRLGDPETQVILPRLHSDLVVLCQAAVKKELKGQPMIWDERVALGVVLTAGGYPENYRKGDVIGGLKNFHSDHKFLFHAGTAMNEDGNVVTDGGRVLCAGALAENFAAAQQNAYALVRRIHWKDVYYRTDIGYKAI